MIKHPPFSIFTGQALIRTYIELYVEEFGAKKSREIIETVFSSKKVDSFISQLRKENLFPGKDGFRMIINTIPYFLFSKAETWCMGTLVAIQKWINDSENDTFKINKFQVHEIVQNSILDIDKTKIHIKETFFDKYYKRLIVYGEEILKNAEKKINEDDAEINDEMKNYLENNEGGSCEEEISVLRNFTRVKINDIIRCDKCSRTFARRDMSWEYHENEPEGKQLKKVCQDCYDPKCDGLEYLESLL